MKGIGLIAVIILLASQIIAVYYSKSIGTWISLAIALTLMGHWKRPIKVGIVVIFLIISVGLISKQNQSSPKMNQRILQIINRSIEDRVIIWNNALEVVKGHSVFGIGLDQLRRNPKFTYETAHAHNQFLHTAAELGIPGLIAYLAILIGVFWMTLEVRKSVLPEWMRLTSRGVGTGIFAFTLFGMGDAIPLGAKPGIFFWISLAMITSIYLYGRNNGFMTQSKEQG